MLCRRLRGARAGGVCDVVDARSECKEVVPTLATMPLATLVSSI
jgi:hypothetical protein